MKVRDWIIIALLVVIAVQIVVVGQSPLAFAEIRRVIDEEAGAVLWLAQIEYEVCDPRHGCDMELGLGMAALPIWQTNLGQATLAVTTPEPTPTWAVPTGVFMTHTPTATLTPGMPTQDPPFIFTPTPTLTMTPTITAIATITPTMPTTP